MVFKLLFWARAPSDLLRAPSSQYQFLKPSKSKPAGEKDDKKKIQMPLFANQKDTGRKKRGRVIGGTDVAEADDYPSYVSIRHDGYHVCGGTIFRIIKRFVTHKYDSWAVSCGSFDEASINFLTSNRLIIPNWVNEKTILTAAHCQVTKDYTV